jgi:acyl carrier protein
MDALDTVKFVEQFAEVVEVQPAELSLSDRFREKVPYWSSLLGFGLLTMIEMEYGVQLSLDEFMKAETVDDLRQAVIRGQQSLAQS